MASPLNRDSRTLGRCAGNATDTASVGGREHPHISTRYGSSHGLHLRATELRRSGTVSGARRVGVAWPAQPLRPHVMHGNVIRRQTVTFDIGDDGGAPLVRGR